MYAYIVDITITLHIQVLAYCKNVPTQLIMGLPKFKQSIIHSKKY